MELTLNEALKKGVAAHKAGQIEEADKLYSAVLKAQPKNPDANYNMGVLYVGLGKIKESLSFFKTALEANSNAGQFWVSYIDTLIKLGLFLDAKTVFAQAKSKGNSGQVFDQLEKRILESSANLQDPPPVKLQPIINIYQQGQLQQALFDASQMLERFPNSAVLYNIAGASNAGLLKFDEAIDNFKQALKINPDNAGTYNNIGNALKEKGDLEEAVASYEQALRIKPDYAEAYYNLGVALKDNGDLEAAIASYKKAIKIKPDYSEAFNNMGVALQDKGNQEEAIASYKQALEIKPDFSESFKNMGISLQDKGDMKAAIASYKQSLKFNPDDDEVYYNMGLALYANSDSEAAITSYKEALRFKPDNAEAYYNMGMALNDKGDPKAAIESYKMALNIKPNYPDVYNNMGIAFNDTGDSEAAIKSYKQVLRFKPDNADAHHNMANSFVSKGDLKAAIKSYKQVLNINPERADAHRALSSLYNYKDKDKDKDKDKHFVKMQNLYLDSNNTDEQQCHLSFALSKASEDLNEISKSFTYLKTGNQLRKKILSYNIKQDLELFIQLKKSYPAIARVALQSTDKTMADTKPVFILGMPRSGTTLVEQIISSHTEVNGAGELDYVERFGQSITKGMIESSTETILDFRQRYIEALKKRADSRSIVIDKMPLNFRYIGLIFAAFPDVKIVHVYRDSAATCWSNYKHYFPAKGVGYNYDLKDITTYFRLYKDLMQFWQGHYGDRIYNLSYDTLTTNQENETRKLIQYLGLEWENDCLSPQSNKRNVLTASQQQIRQKVYQGSSQQWRKFEPYLNGVFDKLESEVHQSLQTKY